MRLGIVWGLVGTKTLNLIPKPSAKKDFCKLSFLPRAIMEWNNLPHDVKGHKTVVALREASRSYLE